jgi:hypothetical protein
MPGSFWNFVTCYETVMHIESTILDGLNSDPVLDASSLLNSYILDDENISQFFQTRLNSSYFDVESFISKFKNSHDPIILSLNIQSLNSKYNGLKDLTLRLQQFSIPLDIIILQETWEIKFPTLLSIPGFQNVIYRTREGMRGGGVGIYIRNGLSFTERRDLEDYSLKTFENITVEIHYPNRSILLSNIYRSPNPPPNFSISDHYDAFLDILDTHLARLSDLNKQVYLFTDSNINLFNLNESSFCSDYLDTLITNGFVQIISKATRIQNNKASLIDHIITNTNLTKYVTGTIIDDLSDHFVNFLQLSSIKNLKNNISTEKKRLKNEMNTNNLKIALQNTDWTPVNIYSLTLIAASMHFGIFLNRFMMNTSLK